MNFPSLDEQLAVLRRGTAQIVTEEELASKVERSIQTGKPLRVKFGIDPTAVDVHLGHTVPLRKMRQFQDLGHLAVIIIGNYTALVGDPSGRDETRARLTAEQVEANAKTYLEQVGKVVDWFAPMHFTDVMDLTSRITVMQLLEREDFSNRVKEEKPIYLHECLYPVMQGWDSVQVRADVELGGTDQLFNLMVGRDFQRQEGQEPQIALTMPILVGTDGTRRMGKSLGNYVGLAETPDEMFGKIMSIPDTAMRSYFELLTDVPENEIAALLASDDPKATKVRLAKTILADYHGTAASESAAEEFDRRFARRELPSDIPEVRVPAADLDPDGSIWIVKLLVKAGMCTTNSEARRAIQQGGVYLDEEKEKVTDVSQQIVLNDARLLWVGARRVKRIKVES
jgi:tyrosyl-tRNA synthetase